MKDVLHSLLSQPRHLRAGAAALALLALTSIHHAYGAFAFATPWRLHVIAIAAPVAIAIVIALWRGSVTSGGRTDQLWTTLAALLILVIPVAAIGLYEGGYNHVLKNLVYFSRGEVEARALVPPPVYEMPHNVLFEATGIAQLPLSIVTALFALQLFREPASATSETSDQLLSRAEHEL